MEATDPGDSGGVRVPHAEILPGLYRIHESGARHFGDALCLYRANRAQDAIPSFVLSVEEYLKGIYMAIAHGEGRGITAAEWDSLQDHAFKLKEVRKRMRGTLGRAVLKQVYGGYSHWDMDATTGKRSMFSMTSDECDKEVAELTRVLQFLKHACIYHDWDDGTSEWSSLGSLPAHVQRSLAFHSMHIAKCYHDLLVHSVGQDLRLPCGTACAVTSPLPKNPFRLYTSRSVLNVLRSTKSVLSCPRTLTMGIVNKSAKIEPINGDLSESHPLVQSIFEFRSEQSKLTDGSHEYPTNCPGQTFDGQPAVSASILVHVRGGSGTIERVTINGTSCDVYDSRIAILLDAERIIERKRGPELSTAALISLFSELGIRSYSFTESIIRHAVSKAHDMLGAGLLHNYPRSTVESIRLATAEGWRGLDPQTRHVISSLLLRDPAAISLDGHESLMQKHAARRFVWDVLCAQKCMYDGMAVLR